MCCGIQRLTERERAKESKCRILEKRSISSPSQYNMNSSENLIAFQVSFNGVRTYDISGHRIALHLRRRESMGNKGDANSNSYLFMSLTV